MMKVKLLLLSLSFAVTTFALTAPPRGWNSYDSYNWHVNETQFLSNCKVMSERLFKFGYDTCVIDFLWYQADDTGDWSLDEECRPLPQVSRWPSTNGTSFKPIADKVHAMGLKFGIHIMVGTSTFATKKNCPIPGTNNTVADIALSPCAWSSESLSVNVTMAAGRMFYDSLYRQYAEWEVDFIKNDCIFGDNFVEDNIQAQSQSIKNTGREIVYSLSPGGHSQGIPEICQQGESISSAVNMYRITNDDWDSWGDIFPSHFDTAAAFAAKGLIAAPGLGGRPSFPDLDMLPLGFITNASDDHPFKNTSLTPNEQRTQLTLWAMARSPLFFGGDLNVLDDLTFSLLTNKDILLVDSTSINNHQVRQTGTLRVWTATIASSKSGAAVYFAAAFNTDTSAAKGTELTGADFGLPNSVTHCSKVTEAWTGATLRPFSRGGSVSLESIGSHGVAFVRMENCEEIA